MIIKNFFLFTLAVLLALPSITMAQSPTLTFGVVPQQSPVKLFKKWKPIVDYLSKETGYRIVLKTEKSIAAFEKELYQGVYDFAYMNPYHYIVAHRDQSYQAHIRANKMIRGILVAPQPIEDKHLADYVQKKEHSYLFPSANAFAATLLLKYELLTEFGIDLNTLKNYKYVNSHDSVYKGVARGVGDLGGGVQRTFMNFTHNRDKQKLHVIYKTKPYPSHPFAFKKTMASTAQEKIAAALLALPDELKQGLSMKKMIKTSNQEYDAIRDLEHKLTITKR